MKKKRPKIKYSKEHEEFLRIKETVALFMDRMRHGGIKMNIQFRLESGHIISVTTLDPATSLGALKIAETIVTNGVHAGQLIDSSLQTLEQRPDLVKRYRKIFR